MQLNVNITDSLKRCFGQCLAQNVENYFKILHLQAYLDTIVAGATDHPYSAEQSVGFVRGYQLGLESFLRLQGHSPLDALRASEYCYACWMELNPDACEVGR